MRTTAWGDHVTIVAASRMFKRAFAIVNDVPGLFFSADIIPPIHTGPVLVLAHYCERHYESTVPVE